VERHKKENAKNFWSRTNRPLLVKSRLFSYRKGQRLCVNQLYTCQKKQRLDDNSPTKNGTKDARVNAQLIKDGGYSVPNLLEGIYAELGEGIKIRDQLTQQLAIIEGGHIKNLTQLYFSEFSNAFGGWKGKAALCTLMMFPFPSQIKEMAPEEVLSKWKPFVGMMRATKLVITAKKSIGIQVGVQFSKHEMEYLIDHESEFIFTIRA